MVGLAFLMVVTAILVWMAAVKYRTGSIQATPWSAQVGARPNPSFTVSPASPTPTPAATASPTATARRAGLDGIADIVNSPGGASIMVIGDGSGDETDEWVSAWVRDLATKATVTFNDWSRTAGRYYNPVKSGSAARQITLWNASADFPTMAGEPQRVGQAWHDADVVLLSYGHRRTAAEIATQLDAVLAAVRAKDSEVPVAVLLQNPDLPATQAVQLRTIQATKAWADTNGLPTIDIYAAFTAAPASLGTLVDRVGSPTPQGATLWAAALARALAG